MMSFPCREGACGCIPDCRKRLVRDANGNVATMFALALVPITFLVGGGADYAVAVKSKSIVQDALDAAMLTTAQKAVANNTLATDRFKSGIAGRNLAFSSLTVTTSTAPDNSAIYIGDAAVTVKTQFLTAIGINNWTIHAHSETGAPASIQTVTVTPSLAQGAFSKDIFVYTRNSAGTITWQQTLLTYRYGVAGSGTAPAIGVSSQTYSVPSYTYFGIGMLVYDSTSTGYNGAMINPYNLYSDVNAAAWVHQTGNCWDPGGMSVHNEDGGNADFMDFVYTMTCTTGPAPAAQAFLRK